MLDFELPVLLAEDFNVPAELDARELRKPRVIEELNLVYAFFPRIVQLPFKDFLKPWLTTPFDIQMSISRFRNSSNDEAIVSAGRCGG